MTGRPTSSPIAASASSPVERRGGHRDRAAREHRRAAYGLQRRPGRGGQRLLDQGVERPLPHVARDHAAQPGLLLGGGPAEQVGHRRRPGGLRPGAGEGGDPVERLVHLGHRQRWLRGWLGWASRCRASPRRCGAAAACRRDRRSPISSSSGPASASTSASATTLAFRERVAATACEVSTILASSTRPFCPSAPTPRTPRWMRGMGDSAGEHGPLLRPPVQRDARRRRARLRRRGGHRPPGDGGRGRDARRDLPAGALARGQPGRPPRPRQLPRQTDRGRRPRARRGHRPGRLRVTVLLRLQGRARPRGADLELLGRPPARHHPAARRRRLAAWPRPQPHRPSRAGPGTTLVRRRRPGEVRRGPAARDRRLRAGGRVGRGQGQAEPEPVGRGPRRRRRRSHRYAGRAGRPGDARPRPG